MLENLVGKRFDKLVVVRYLGVFDKKRKWLCKCDCGKETTAFTAYLKNGHKGSCGCKHWFSHAQSGNKTYSSWDCMIQRCTNPHHKQYHNYGGRGITIDSKWLKFENFYADMGDRPEGTSLDRIDFNGNYCKENCRWADSKTQGNNRRNNRYIEYRGTTHTISEWARILNIPRNTLDNRLTRSKWSVEKAFNVKGA